MAGNLTTALATKQAFNDPDRDDRYMGLLSGSYLMIPQQHAEDLAKVMPNLDLEQGYLVAKDADPKLPLATRVRCLFKMDFAEAVYISELRSGAAGRFSYRRVAWEMYLALQRQHPALAGHVRVTDFTEPIDMLKR